MVTYGVNILLTTSRGATAEPESDLSHRYSSLTVEYTPADEKAFDI
jgi:hypothetical protein